MRKILIIVCMLLIGLPLLGQDTTTTGGAGKGGTRNRDRIHMQNPDDTTSTTGGTTRRGSKMRHKRVHKSSKMKKHRNKSMDKNNDKSGDQKDGTENKQDK